MPPRPKYSREAILSAALDLVRKSGIESLTARELGNALGSSSQPVFTVFRNMDEVQCEVRAAAKALYGEYVKRGLAEEKPFLGVGKQYVLFSMQEPKLFQILFMTERRNAPDVSGALPFIDENYEEILSAVQTQYRMDRADARRIYRHLWIYAHGIATLCATGVSHLTQAELSELFQDVSAALFTRIKAEKYETR